MDFRDEITAADGPYLPRALTPEEPMEDHAAWMANAVLAIEARDALLANEKGE